MRIESKINSYLKKKQQPEPKTQKETELHHLTGHYRGRGHFPSDKAATKLIYLVLQNVEAKWSRPPIAWHQAKAQFAIHFEDRFVLTD